MVVDMENEGKVDDIEIIPAWMFLLANYFVTLT